MKMTAREPCSTTDFVHFEDHGVALPKGSITEQDHTVATGCAYTDDHGQHRGLDPADAPEQAPGSVADGVVAGRVQADDPVGLVAAPCSSIEVVVVR